MIVVEWRQLFEFELYFQGQIQLVVQIYKSSNCLCKCFNSISMFMSLFAGYRFWGAHLSVSLVLESFFHIVLYQTYKLVFSAPEEDCCKSWRLLSTASKEREREREKCKIFLRVEMNERKWKWSRKCGCWIQTEI